MVTKLMVKHLLQLPLVALPQPIHFLGKHPTVYAETGLFTRQDKTDGNVSPNRTFRNRIDEAGSARWMDAHLLGCFCRQ